MGERGEEDISWIPTCRDGYIGIFQCTNIHPTDFGTYGHRVLDSTLPY